MGRVLNKTKSGSKVYIECTDLFTDVDAYIEKYENEGFSRDNIIFLIENEKDNNQSSPLMLNLHDLLQARRQLEKLTQNVNSNDAEVEKFVKIALSIYKNIKFAKTKTNNRNVGKSQNFIDGLNKGKCVCIGFAQILKEALNMHGIEAEIVESTISENRGHAWVKVKLGGVWYNWDQTNIKAQTLSLSTMGRALKSDQQIEKGKIYKNNNSIIRCNTNPSEGLIYEINYYAKMHKRSAPVLPKSNFISKFLNRIRKKHALALPEASQRTNINSQRKGMQITEQEIVESLEGINLWKVSVWNQTDVKNKFKSVYMGLSATETIDTIKGKNEDEFWTVFNNLMQNSTNTDYIGNMKVITENDMPKKIIGQSPESAECIKMSSRIKDIIQQHKMQRTRETFVPNDRKQSEWIK